MNEDIIIRVEPELEPQELFRRSVLEKTKLGMCMGFVDNEIRITVDNIGLLASLLDVDTNNEVIIDLIRDSLINNKEVIEPDEFIKLIFDKVLPTDGIIEETLRDAFSVVDVDGDDVITGADIYQVMLSMGEVASDEELTRMLKSVDGDGDGRATFEEFRNFILGIEPDPPEVAVEIVEPSEPTPEVNKPPPPHRRRRSLFSYGRMVKKQLEVVFNLKNKSANVSNDEDNTSDQSDGSKEEGSGTNKLSPDSLSPSSDEDYVFANLFGEHKAEDVTSIMTQDTLTTASDVLSDALNEQVEEATDAPLIVKPITLNEPMNIETVVRSNLKQEALNTSMEKVTNPKHTDKIVNLQSSYKKTSPYYGRVRPDNFALNPLPPLQVEVTDDEVTSHSGSTRSDQTSSRCSAVSACVQMVDGVQQATGDFKQDMMSTEQSNNSNTDSNQRDDNDQCLQRERKHNSTLTDIHEIKRLKLVHCMQNDIFERSNTSSDMRHRMTVDNNQDPVLNRASCEPNDLQSKVLNEYKQSPNKDSRDVFGEIQNGMKRHQPTRPQTAKPVGHFQRKFRHTDSTTKMTPSSPKLVRNERSPTPETSEVLPMRPQTAKPSVSVHVPAPRKHTELDSVDSKHSNVYNRGVSRSSLWKLKQSESFETKPANAILLSDAIKHESLYSDEISRSEHHRGFRSIRPLARVLMNLQAAARKTRRSLPEVSSISRMLEEDDTTFIKKPSMPITKTLSETSTAKTKLLNLDFSLDKPIRPLLKRASTLTRIPLIFETKHHVVSRESKTLRM